MKKLAAIAAAVGLALLSLTGCAQSGVKTSAEATPENPMVLTLAHGLSETFFYYVCYQQGITKHKVHAFLVTFRVILERTAHCLHNRKSGFMCTFH